MNYILLYLERSY